MNDSKDSVGVGFEVSIGNEFPMSNGIRKKTRGNEDILAEVRKDLGLNKLDWLLGVESLSMGNRDAK